MVVRVSKRGRFTIPKKIRDKYGFHDKILIVEAEDGLVIKKPPSPE